MTQYHMLASEGQQRYIYTKKKPKNTKEKKNVFFCLRKKVWLLMQTIDSLAAAPWTS